MQTPLELTFRNMEHTDEVEELVRERARRLDGIFGRITSCHVYVTAPHQRHKTGNRYEVHIELRVPGGELVVNNKPGTFPAHEHVRVAVRDAFKAMEDRLKDWAQKNRDEVKVHEGALQGRIAEINHAEGYGQILATDNRLIYFHRNAVVDGRFEELKRQDPVELVVRADESEIGPQASTVRAIGPMEYDPA